MGPILLAQSSASLASQWESQLQRQPEQIDVRANLIREYFRLSRQDPAAEEPRVRHILWMVRYQPAAPVLGEPVATGGDPGEMYDSVAKAWLLQVGKPDVSPQVLSNAANFFRPREPQRSVELLQKARTLDPKNPKWTGMLGETLAMQIAGGTALNQNGLPNGVDASKTDSPEAARIMAMLLASKDADLIAATAGGLQMRVAISPSIAGHKAEIGALAEQLLRRGQSLDTQNPKWHRLLAQFYAHQAERATGDRRTAYLRQSMAEFDAVAAADPQTATACPPWRYARIAVAAGQLDKAEAAAHLCLAQISKASFQDDGIHESNLILGRVALRRGDLKSAGVYLLAATRVQGKGPLSSFGPNMMLARELLEKGERDVVLEYFRLCGAFWSYDLGQLARWTQQVKAGEMPDFGANVVY